MARAKLPEPILAPYFRPPAVPRRVARFAGGATVEVRLRGGSDTTGVTLYDAPSGGSTVANPVTCDDLGRPGAYVSDDTQRYDLLVSGTGIEPVTIEFDPPGLGSGGGGGGAGTPDDGSVTAAKLAAALKPTTAGGSAAATDVAVRRLGTGSTHAAAGDDARLPTSGQKDALAGTAGTPSSSNPFATKQTSDQKAGPGSSNSQDGRVLVTPSADAENGLVIKAPNSSWGDESVLDYAEGQAIMVLKEGTADATSNDGQDADNPVMFRVNRGGGVGFVGGMHVATGLRKRAGDPDPNYSIHINPTIDSVGLIIDAANDSPADDYLWVRSHDGTMKVKVDKDGILKSNVATRVQSPGSGAPAQLILCRGDGNFDGSLVVANAADVGIAGAAAGDLVLRAFSVAAGGNGSGKIMIGADTWMAKNSQGTTEHARIDVNGIDVLNASAAGRVFIGSQFGLPTVALGTSADAYIHRGGAGSLWLNPTTEVKVVDAYIELDEISADPSAPAADGGRLYLKDNGAGKTQLCVKFNTGAVQVLATQP